MLSTDPSARRVPPGRITGAKPPSRGKSRIEPTSLRFVLGTALGVGVVSFLASELMHYILVPDLGRHRERLLAEALSALIVSCLAARLVQITRERQRLTMARMQVIAEMNHHSRNALSPIFLGLDGSDNQQLVRLISEGVERIDWALREILPRQEPFQAVQQPPPGDVFRRRENEDIGAT
jgi:hypothetical protein